MWPWRKTKNRKFTRTHVLDVRLRSDQIHATRMRLAAMALGMTFGTILGFYLIWRTGEFVLNRCIYENKSFAITEIEVLTDGVLPAEQLRRWAGVKPGENILALDLSRVKRDLEMVSVVRNVAVERILPHTLRLRISERTPIAEVRLLRTGTNGGTDLGALHLDRDGYVMAIVGTAPPGATGTNNSIFSLPIILGLDPKELVPGKPLKSIPAHRALQLLTAFKKSAVAAQTEIQSIDITAPDILMVRTSTGIQVTFGEQDLEAQLRRWHSIQEYQQAAGKTFAAIDLSVTSNVPTRPIEAGTAPQTPVRPRNLPTNTRRRNV